MRASSSSMTRGCVAQMPAPTNGRQGARRARNDKILHEAVRIGIQVQNKGGIDWGGAAARMCHPTTPQGRYIRSRPPSSVGRGGRYVGLYSAYSKRKAPGACRAAQRTHLSSGGSVTGHTNTAPPPPPLSFFWCCVCACVRARVRVGFCFPKKGSYLPHGAGVKKVLLKACCAICRTASPTIKGWTLNPAFGAVAVSGLRRNDVE